LFPFVQAVIAQTSETMLPGSSITTHIANSHRQVSSMFNCAQCFRNWSYDKG